MIGRLIVDAPSPGIWNMSVDAAILEAFAPGDPITLRIYRWEQPTLSLGYFQSIRDRVSHPESEAIPLVRRATGGGAIVHDRELTYSIVVPHHNRMAGISENLYRSVHQCIIHAIQHLGTKVAMHGNRRWRVGAPDPFLCFQRRTENDLVISGYKICGSAQRRSTHAILQHGSVLLSASPFAPQLPGVMELAGLMGELERSKAEPQQADAASVTIEDNLHEEVFRIISRRLVIETERCFSLQWEKGAVSPGETPLIGRIEQERFGNDRWTAKR